MKIMKNKNDKLQFRQIGKGFVLAQIEKMVGRVLTQTFADQHERTYVKINGELTLLTAEHCFLAAD
ncbi:MAG: hypothetical protein GY702_24900 [Desulfobulbaceae bacterium]|nr:hypothetical protein [Desulfobulbaceae bacterium]